MFDLAKTQAAIREFGFDGWLLGDFRGSNPLARRILGIADDAHTSRRYFYFVPAHGEPIKLVHRIEMATLDHLPGSKQIYLRWQELESALTDLVQGKKRVAMEYSPRNANPYIARVDAGTVEIVKAAGVAVGSSGDLVQTFEATWSDAQWSMHQEADRVTTAAYDLAWGFIADRVRGGGETSEVEVQNLIMDHFQNHGMTTYHAPIVGANAHSGDPHYAPSPDRDTLIGQGDFVLLDLWAKVNRPGGVYSDLTRVAFVGETVPEKYEKVFQIVAQARDAAIAVVRQAYAADQPLQGWQVDDAARDVIEKAGYGKNYVHRTGHNIGQETHGNGANMDNLETREERLVMRRTCFSIEPGIYLDEFGVRSEVNVFIDAEGKVHVTGGPLQTEVLAILA